MKLIYTSLGVAAIGVAAIQSVQGQSTDPSRSWSVSASLRGFYDDNVHTTHSDKLESYGVEISPTIAYSLPLEQTDITASYTFGYKWYEKDLNGNDDHDDQTHTFGLSLRHSFNERLVMTVQDSFVIGQEPDVLRVGNNGDATFQRISGDNIRNYGAITFNAQMTPVFGLEAGYANALYDYDDDSDFGNSARLDRLEHAVHVDGRWNLQRDTIGILGSQFRLIDYTADDLLESGSNLKSDSRNSRMYYLYAGVEHTFRPDLFGSLKAGAVYSDFYNSPDDETTVSPYVRANLSYRYAPECNLALGVSVDQSATDQFSVSGSGNSITTSTETTVAYASVNHRILADLYGSVIGSYQYSTFDGGTLDDDSQNYFGAGVNLEYRINRHVSANAGYNYDWVDSDSSSVSDSDYDRNRVYLGATFVY